MIVYLDTSALIKTLIDEEGSDIAQAIWDSADALIASRLTYPEARAALAMAARLDRLTETLHQQAKANLQLRWEQLLIAEMSEEVANLGGDLAERYQLRALDAVHLATALTVGSDVIMATWDDQLRKGAINAGLATVPSA